MYIHTHRKREICCCIAEEDLSSSLHRHRHCRIEEESCRLAMEESHQNKRENQRARTSVWWIKENYSSMEDVKPNSPSSKSWKFLFLSAEIISYNFSVQHSVYFDIVRAFWAKMTKNFRSFLFLFFFFWFLFFVLDLRVYRSKFENPTRIFELGRWVPWSSSLWKLIIIGFRMKWISKDKK